MTNNRNWLDEIENLFFSSYLFKYKRLSAATKRLTTPLPLLGVSVTFQKTTSRSLSGAIKENNAIYFITDPIGKRATFPLTKQLCKEQATFRGSNLNIVVTLLCIPTFRRE